MWETGAAGGRRGKKGEGHSHILLLTCQQSKKNSYTAFIRQPSYLRTNCSVLDETSRPTGTLDRGIKLRIAVDALPLDVWCTYSESASTHRGR